MNWVSKFWNELSGLCCIILSFCFSVLAYIFYFTESSYYDLMLMGAVLSFGFGFVKIAEWLPKIIKKKKLKKEREKAKLNKALTYELIIAKENNLKATLLKDLRLLIDKIPELKNKIRALNDKDFKAWHYEVKDILKELNLGIFNLEFSQISFKPSTHMFGDKAIWRRYYIRGLESAEAFLNSKIKIELTKLKPKLQVKK